MNEDSMAVESGDSGLIEKQNDLVNQEEINTPEKEDSFNVNIKATGLSEGAVDSKFLGLISMTTILVIAMGFSAGFFGYNKIPEIVQKYAFSGDIKKILDKNEDDNPIQNTNILDTNSADWPTYSNIRYKYKIKYPDAWFNKGTDNSFADEISLTSSKPGTGSLNGFEIKVNFRENDQKTLKNWILKNNDGLISGNLNAVTINGENAFQIAANSPYKGLVTYVIQQNKIMIISYYSSDATQLSKAQGVYNQVLNSIKLNQ